MKPVLEIENLNVKVEATGNNILDGFNLKLFPGEVTSLVGWSGSGKSTAAYAAFHLCQDGLGLSYDKFELFGRKSADLTESGWKKIRGEKIVMIPQNPSISFHPFISIEKQFTEFYKLKNKRVSRDEIIRMIETVGIDNARRKAALTPAGLSGGEKQRLLIAMFSGLDPEIIVADEPTTALDAMNEKNVLKLLYGLVREKNISLILVSHDLRIVKNLSDSVILLKNGKMIETFEIKNGKIPELTSEYAKKLFFSREKN